MTLSIYILLYPCPPRVHNALVFMFFIAPPIYMVRHSASIPPMYYLVDFISSNYCACTYSLITCSPKTTTLIFFHLFCCCCVVIQAIIGFTKTQKNMKNVPPPDLKIQFSKRKALFCCLLWSSFSSCRVNWMWRTFIRAKFHAPPTPTLRLSTRRNFTFLSAGTSLLHVVRCGDYLRAYIQHTTRTYYASFNLYCGHLFCPVSPAASLSSSQQAEKKKDDRRPVVKNHRYLFGVWMVWHGSWRECSRGRSMYSNKLIGWSDAGMIRAPHLAVEQIRRHQNSASVMAGVRWFMNPALFCEARELDQVKKKKQNSKFDESRRAAMRPGMPNLVRDKNPTQLPRGRREDHSSHGLLKKPLSYNLLWWCAMCEPGI